MECPYYDPGYCETRDCCECDYKEEEVTSYNVILADPPWKYHTDMVTGHKSLDHYPSMSNDELKSMDVRGMCDDQCVLFMWTTTPNLDVAIEVGRAWGFDYKQVAFVWDKVNPCCGNYTMPQVELVLVFRPKKGRLPKRSKTNVRQVVVEKKREHSRKPEYVQDMIDLMYPDAKKLELFARRSRPGWDVWGNETAKFDKEET